MTVSESERRTSVLLAVQTALGLDRGARLLERVVASNPALRGAHVADVLDLVDDADGCIEQTEPFYERGDGGRVEQMLLRRGVPDTHAGLLVAISVCAVALLQPDVPPLPDVSALASVAAAIACRDEILAWEARMQGRDRS